MLILSYQEVRLILIKIIFLDKKYNLTDPIGGERCSELAGA